MKIQDDKGYRAILASVTTCKKSVTTCKELRKKHRALLDDETVERAARTYLQSGSLLLIQNAGLSLCDVRIKILEAALRIAKQNLKQYRANWRDPDKAGGQNL